MARRTAASPGGAGSPAAVTLTRQGIAFDIHTYEHDPRARDFGDEAVRELTRSLQCDPHAVFKTLVWLVDSRPCVAVASVPARISAKKLAAALKGRSAALADAEVAERISGSVLGAISPVALRRPVPVVIDAAVHHHEQVFVSAGRRGVEVALAPADLVRATDGTIAPIAVQGSANR